jgi:enoyl-CoA hydratase/carnithine racemase
VINYALEAMSQTSFQIRSSDALTVLRLSSDDGTNRLTRACIASLTETLCALRHVGDGVIITGNSNFFSVGADLKEIAYLTGPAAYEFARLGQDLMSTIASFPAPVYAAIAGYCMGGGLDLALACHRRIGAPNAIFGHRGAALGLITGWGGTQRLPRLIGKGQALAMLVAADKIDAVQALRLGLVDVIAADPVAEAARQLQR